MVLFINSISINLYSNIKEIFYQIVRNFKNISPSNVKIINDHGNNVDSDVYFNFYIGIKLMNKSIRIRI